MADRDLRALVEAEISALRDPGGRATPIDSPIRWQLADRLQTILDKALDAPLVKVEYRVVSDVGYALKGYRQLDSAREERDRLADLFPSDPCRIQSRTVSATPWVNVEEGTE